MAVQRCHLNVVFADLCSATRLCELCDPEIAAEIFRVIRKVAEEVVEENGGVLNQFYGDGFLAVFGYPTTNERHDIDAIFAALKLHDAVEALQLDHLLPDDFKLQLHSGVHCGLVVIDDGDYAQGRFCIIGDAPNTAARLSDAAKPGEVIASAAVLRGCSAFFDIHALEPLELKGKSALVEAFRVNARSVVSTRFEASQCKGLTDFVGRDDEMQKLHDVIVKADGDGFRQINIVGEAGLGKTRLATEFLDSLDISRFSIYQCSCYGDSRGYPLQVFIHLLRALLDIKPSLSNFNLERVVDINLKQHIPSKYSLNERIINLLSKIRPEEKQAPLLAREDLLGVLYEIINELALEKRLVILIDDWHWADDSSLQLNFELAAKLVAKPVTLITTCRPDTGYGFSAAETNVFLNPFNRETANDLINVLLSKKFEPVLTSKIYKLTGGNALFIEELCQTYCQDKNDNYFLEERDDAIPTSLQGLVRARIDLLEPELRKFVDVASILGSFFEMGLLEQLVGYCLSVENFQRLNRCGIFYSSDTAGILRFRHGITRDVIYESVNLADREQYHYAAAVEIEKRSTKKQRNADEILAYHYLHSNNKEKAIEYARKSGNHALSISSLDKARYHYLNAINILKSIDHSGIETHLLLDITCQYALACSYSPDKEQIETLTYVLHRARNNSLVEQVCKIEYWLGWIHYALGNLQESINYYQLALEGAGYNNNLKLLTQIHVTLGQSFAAAGQYQNAEEYLRKGLSIKKQHPSTTNLPIGSAYGQACLAMVVTDKGDFSQGKRLLDVALESITGKNQAIEASICDLYAAVLLWEGNWEQAKQLAAQAMQTAERVAGPYTYTMGRAITAYANWKINRDKSSKEKLLRALDWFENREIKLYLSFVYAWLADVMYESGDYAKTIEAAEHAIDCAQKGDKVGEALAYRLLVLTSLVDSGEATENTAEYYLKQAEYSAQARQSEHEGAKNLLCLANIEFAQEKYNFALENANRAAAKFDTLKFDYFSQQARELAKACQSRL